MDVPAGDAYGQVSGMLVALSDSNFLGRYFFPPFPRCFLRNNIGISGQNHCIFENNASQRNQ